MMIPDTNDPVWAYMYYNSQGIMVVSAEWAAATIAKLERETIERCLALCSSFNENAATDGEIVVVTYLNALQAAIRALQPTAAAQVLQEAQDNDLEHALASALNRFSAENESNTPDWILAQFLLGCLAAWNRGTQQRETWYGRDARPSEPND